MATARAPTARAETSTVSPICNGEPCKSSPSPFGERTKANGTRKAGRVYFQVSIIVLKAFPPVTAAAATAARAVGGLTSERTA